MKKLREIFLATLVVVMAFGLISCNEEGNNGGVEESTFEVSISGASSFDETGNGGVFTIALDESNNTGSSISVSYDLSGTATSSVDYQALSGSVSIQNGSSETSVTLTVIDDERVEGDETIIVTLDDSSLPSNVSLGSTATATLTITDDDECTGDDSTDQDNAACDHQYAGGSTYNESVVEGTRSISASGIPNHDYGNQFDDIPQSNVQVSAQNHMFTMTTNPSAANSTTSILDSDYRPKYKFGVALNGVTIDPAPAEPFIFEDGNGEYNWDWVYEPNNNMEAVGLDCAVAHVQPDGTYHYHGDMAPLAELYSQGISVGSAPQSTVQVGWAADGYPIVYRYGPTANGQSVELLESSYQIKSGERPGDGVDAPCGEYNGKYTNDYEWVSGAGDLDECNGISRSITIGNDTFDYFYVITEDFPVISRCFSGTPNSSFLLGGQ